MMLGLNTLTDYGLVLQLPSFADVELLQQQIQQQQQQQQQQNAYTDQQIVDSIYFSGNEAQSNIINVNNTRDENKVNVYNDDVISYGVGLDDSLVGNDWSLEDFLLGGCDVTTSYDVDLLPSEVSSNVSSPATVSSSSSIDNLFDELNFLPANGSPLSSSSSSVNDGVVPGSPLTISIPGSPHSSVSAGSPYVADSPYGSSSSGDSSMEEFCLL